MEEGTVTKGVKALVLDSIRLLGTGTGAREGHGKVAPVVTVLRW